MSDDVKPFKTSDTGLAAYLHYHGMRVLGTKRADDGKSLNFIFVDQPERTQRVEEYMTRKSSEVVAEQYYVSYKRMSKYLREGPTI